MIILAVDLGKARTGIAVCDKSEILASPVCVINEYNRDVLLDKIADICEQRKPELIVVGLPKNMDSSEGESAVNARDFADRLGEKTGISTTMCDERGTTITAAGYMNMNDVRGKKRKSVIDAVAATIILEDYLSFRRNNKKQ